jgi:hypothetical protein
MGDTTSLPQSCAMLKRKKEALAAVKIENHAVAKKRTEKMESTRK